MKATTDSNGKYRLYNMTSGLYLFQASQHINGRVIRISHDQPYQVEYSGIKFEPTQLKISPSTPNIPAFIPNRYNVVVVVVVVVVVIVVVFMQNTITCTYFNVFQIFCVWKNYYQLNAN